MCSCWFRILCVAVEYAWDAWRHDYNHVMPQSALEVATLRSRLEAMLALLDQFSIDGA